MINTYKSWIYCFKFQKSCNHLRREYDLGIVSIYLLECWSCASWRILDYLGSHLINSGQIFYCLSGQISRNLSWVKCVWREVPLGEVYSIEVWSIDWGQTVKVMICDLNFYSCRVYFKQIFLVGWVTILDLGLPNLGNFQLRNFYLKMTLINLASLRLRYDSKVTVKVSWFCFKLSKLNQTNWHCWTKVIFCCWTYNISIVYCWLVCLFEGVNLKLGELTNWTIADTWEFTITLFPELKDSHIICLHLFLHSDQGWLPFLRFGYNCYVFFFDSLQWALKTA